MMVIPSQKTVYQVDGKNLEEVNNVNCQGNKFYFPKREVKGKVIQYKGGKRQKLHFAN